MAKSDYNLKPLTLTLGASRGLYRALGVAGMAAGVLALAWPWWAVPSWWLAAGGATWCAIRRHASLASPQAMIALRYDASGALHVQSGNGTWHSATLLGSSCVTPWCTVLNLRLAGKRCSRSMVIVPDAVDAQTFRRLRVRLRWGGES